MWNKIMAVWEALPPKLRAWLKGAEVAVVTAVVASCVAAPVADLHTKRGISEFAAGVFAAAYGALRLYVAQSPLPVAAKVTNPAFTLNSIVQTGGAGRSCDGETKIGASDAGYDTAPKIEQGDSK